MASIPLSLSSSVSGLQASPAVRLPTPYESWQGNGLSCQLNFSGAGVGYSALPGSLPVATGNVTLQVSNDPAAGQAATNPTAYAQARWNNHTILVNQTVDNIDSIFFPCAFARLVGTVTSGTVICLIGCADTSPAAA